MSEYIYTYMEILMDTLDRIAPFRELGCYYFVRALDFIVNNLFNVIGMNNDLSEWWDFIRNDEV